ncbi:hypothetical protein phi18_084 [Bacillus phage phi18]|nr:hypothetical protein phi18_084 [Bacillus phage phi18]
MNGTVPFAKQMSEEKIQEIAKTPESRFDWWIQTKFGVLPTDPRFTDLTKEQKSLMFWHLQMDKNPENFVKDGKARDDDYDEEEESLLEDGEESGIPKPIPEGGYHDPEFDEEWNEDFEEPDISDIPENPSDPLPDDFDVLGEADPKVNIDGYEKDEWEEV